MAPYLWIPPPPHTADDVLAHGRYGAMQYMRKGSKLADTIAGETAEFAVFPYARRSWYIGAI